MDGDTHFQPSFHANYRACFREKHQIHHKAAGEKDGGQPSRRTSVRGTPSFDEFKPARIKPEFQLHNQRLMKADVGLCSVVCLHYTIPPPNKILYPASPPEQWIFYHRDQLVQLHEKHKSDVGANRANNRAAGPQAPKISNIVAEEISRRYKLMIGHQANVNTAYVHEDLGDPYEAKVRESCFKIIDPASFKRYQENSAEIHINSNAPMARVPNIKKRLIFHYIGHGVPWPAVQTQPPYDPTGEFWLFDDRIERYMPVNMWKALEMSSGRKFFIENASNDVAMDEAEMARPDRERILDFYMLSSNPNDEHTAHIYSQQNRNSNELKMTVEGEAVGGTFIWDCSKAGYLIDRVRDYKQCVARKLKEYAQTSYTDTSNRRERYIETERYLKNCWHLGACQNNEILPFETHLVSDLFGSTLLGPLKQLFAWHACKLRSGYSGQLPDMYKPGQFETFTDTYGKSVEVLKHIDMLQLVEYIPGRDEDVLRPTGPALYLDQNGQVPPLNHPKRPRPRPMIVGRNGSRNGSRGSVNRSITRRPKSGTEDRSSFHGRLYFVMESCTHAMLWATMGREQFVTMYPQREKAHQKLMKNYLIAQRIMKYYNCNPMSEPTLPDCSNHPLWTLLDYILDEYMRRVLQGLHNYQIEESSQKQANSRNSSNSIPAEKERMRRKYVEKAFKDRPELKMLGNDDFFFKQCINSLQLWIRQQDSTKELTRPPKNSGVDENFAIATQAILLRDFREISLDVVQDYIDLGTWAIEDTYLLNTVRILSELSRSVHTVQDVRTNLMEKKFCQPLIFIMAKVMSYYETKDLIDIFDLTCAPTGGGAIMMPNCRPTGRPANAARGATAPPQGRNMRPTVTPINLFTAIAELRNFEKYTHSNYSALVLSTIANYVYSLKRLAHEEALDLEKISADGNGPQGADRRQSPRQYTEILEKFKEDPAYHQKLTKIVNDYIADLENKHKHISEVLHSKCLFYKWLFILQGVLWMLNAPAKWDSWRCSQVGIESYLLRCGPTSTTNKHDPVTNLNPTVAPAPVRAAVIFSQGMFIGATPHLLRNDEHTPVDMTHSPHTLRLDIQAISLVIEQCAVDSNALVRMECIDTFAWFLRVYYRTAIGIMRRELNKLNEETRASNAGVAITLPRVVGGNGISGSYGSRGPSITSTPLASTLPHVIQGTPMANSPRSPFNSIGRSPASSDGGTIHGSTPPGDSVYSDDFSPDDRRQLSSAIRVICTTLLALRDDSERSIKTRATQLVSDWKQFIAKHTQEHGSGSSTDSDRGDTAVTSVPISPAGQTESIAVRAVRSRASSQRQRAKRETTLLGDLPKMPKSAVISYAREHIAKGGLFVREAVLRTAEQENHYDSPFTRFYDTSKLDQATVSQTLVMEAKHMFQEQLHHDTRRRRSPRPDPERSEAYMKQSALQLRSAPHGQVTNLTFHPYQERLYGVTDSGRQVAIWDIGPDFSSCEDYAISGDQELPYDEMGAGDGARRSAGRLPKNTFQMLKNKKVSSMHLINTDSTAGMFLNVMTDGNVQVFDIKGSPVTTFNSIFYHRELTATISEFKRSQRLMITCDSAWNPVTGELAVCHDRQIFIWNCEIEQHIYTKAIDLNAEVTSMAWLPNGLLLVACSDGYLKVVDKRMPCYEDATSGYRNIHPTHVGQSGRKPRRFVSMANTWSNPEQASFMCSSQVSTAEKLQYQLEYFRMRSIEDTNSLTPRWTLQIAAAAQPRFSDVAGRLVPTQSDQAPLVAAHENLPYFAAHTDSHVQIYSINNTGQSYTPVNQPFIPDSDSLAGTETDVASEKSVPFTLATSSRAGSRNSDGSRSVKQSTLPLCSVPKSMADGQVNDPLMVEMAWHPLYPVLASSGVGHTVHVYRGIADVLTGF